MRIIPSWLREFVDVTADDRQLAEDLTSAGIAVESVQEENGQIIYEMDLTTNRVDAMNHYGVAREVSAIYDVELKPVEPKLPKQKVRRSPPPNVSGPIGMTNLAEELNNADTGVFPIVIEDPHGCARYTARIVRNVKIGPSPNDGHTKAANAVIFELKSNALISNPSFPTASDDDAGLPLFPGLVRYDEVQAGAIDHALRFESSRAYSGGVCGLAPTSYVSEYS